MKRILFFGLIITILSSCGNSGNGELIGTQDRAIWQPTDPYGMVFIPQGSFVMGPSDQDVPFANVTAAKTVSVGAFYMDETEITNNEYRQFTNWVRDSIAHRLLGDAGIEGHLIEEDEYGNFLEPASINWKERIRWDDIEVREILEEEMYLPEHERFNGKRQIDSRKLIYVYQELDLNKAAAKANRENDATGKRDRSVFLKDVEVNIFPDTLAWMHDYAYAFNEPMTTEYFWHPAFDDYPVVGINWQQAVAFTKWRTQIMNRFLRKNNEPTLPEFRLPTESEWEYAARGGQDLSPYPWGGPYTRNHKGCFLANFKPLRGNYTADGGLRSVKVASYNPNAYGLYDMAGNVSEWTSNTFDESAFSYAHDMNMDYRLNNEDADSEVLKRKVIRGGSWKDISYFIQTSTRDYEYQDTAKCYIGFRCAVDFLGRDKKDFE
ncbi:MAG: gliding motility-associated lipoprotein [Flavobacteriales bacterium TMED123]|nr:MAG: gliding motility-associated lipoprotein [Flavobacteriales bacterium TMED123]|tara:strand:+ start:11762 stop:13066 length:1305 start_codon:yes stop_codon:yes gene_type:complete